MQFQIEFKDTIYLNLIVEYKCEKINYFSSLLSKHNANSLIFILNYIDSSFLCNIEKHDFIQIKDHET